MENDLPEKLAYYLRVLSEHVTDALQSEGVKRSCVASLLLVFAGMDGCGRLIHEKERPSNDERLTAFLQLMGEPYAQNAARICALRHALVHSALNVGAAMSYLPDAERLHLYQPDGAPHIFISTSAFIQDFNATVERLRTRLLTDEGLRSHAESRLEWVDVFDGRAHWGTCVTTAPPLGFRFVRAKNEKRK